MKTVKTDSSSSELKYYIQTLIFGVLVFSGFYWYTDWMGIPNVLNKAIADTSVLLIGLSMLLTSVCYFWNFIDSKIVFRKYLGLIGFAFGVTHVVLSYSSLLRLLEPATWTEGKMWPFFTAFLATVIFTIMALISNKISTKILGGKLWKRILRLGYLALLLIFAHVFLLKSARWLTWWEEGMNRPPSLSLLMSVFILIVIIMRIILAIALARRKKANNNYNNSR